MKPALNAKQMKLFKEKDAQFLGDHVIMLIIHIASTNGPAKKRQNAPYAKIYGPLLRQPNNDSFKKMNSNIYHFSRVL